MEKQEETQNSLGMAWLEEVKRCTAALDRQTAALKYLADVIGFNSDKFFEAGKNTPAPSMTIEHELPPADTPIVPAAKQPDTPKPEPTIEDVRAAMNAFARRQGKDSAFALIKKYSSSLKVEDIAPERYGELLMEIAGDAA